MQVIPARRRPPESGDLARMREREKGHSGTGHGGFRESSIRIGAGSEICQAPATRVPPGGEPAYRFVAKQDQNGRPRLDQLHSDLILAGRVREYGPDRWHRRRGQAPVGQTWHVAPIERRLLSKVHPTVRNKIREPCLASVPIERSQDALVQRNARWSVEHLGSRHQFASPARIGRPAGTTAPAGRMGMFQA